MKGAYFERVCILFVFWNQRGNTLTMEILEIVQLKKISLSSIYQVKKENSNSNRKAELLNCI